MRYADPGTTGSVINFKQQYGNFIGGEFVDQVDGKIFDVICPVNGKSYTRVARSNEKDVERALDAAHGAADSWGQTSVAERSSILSKIADRLEQDLERFAVAEAWGNGKAVRETLAADLPLTVDHFRYFAGVIRAEESGLSELDANTLSMHYREPLGVVGQIIPWNFPLLMMAWKVAPALATGNCVVLKPAEQTPVTALLFAELVSDLLPKGVLNIVNGFGLEAGKPLASSKRIAKIAFTGETTTGREIMGQAAQNLIPVTLELGGKSPNIFLEDCFAKDDNFRQKSLEGFAMFALNQGEVCTCPSRAFVQETIYDQFMEAATKRVDAIKMGHPLDTETMMGAQVSIEQMDKIQSYLSIGKQEGATVRTGGTTMKIEGLEDGYYIQPTIFEGTNNMRVFQEEIFGPVVSVAKFKTPEEALQMANDTDYGLGAGLWTRDIHQGHRLSRGLKAGRVWLNCYHLYPAHASFGGYKCSGVGRETHKMMLDHYTQTKNVLISHDQNPMGFF